MEKRCNHNCWILPQYVVSFFFPFFPFCFGYVNLVSVHFLKGFCLLTPLSHVLQGFSSCLFKEADDLICPELKTGHSLEYMLLSLQTKCSIFLLLVAEIWRNELLQNCLSGEYTLLLCSTCPTPPPPKGCMVQSITLSSEISQMRVILSNEQWHLGKNLPALPGDL